MEWRCDGMSDVDVGCRMWNVGCRIYDVGFMMLGFRMYDGGCGMSDVLRSKSQDPSPKSQITSSPNLQLTLIHISPSPNLLISSSPHFLITTSLHGPIIG
ncbi:MAG: hypothetical protein IPH45_08470 [Bacteroidales bacterium]|nr:hypothetical protein [Bacteroidales bacterium]